MGIEFVILMNLLISKREECRQGKRECPTSNYFNEGYSLLTNILKEYIRRLEDYYDNRDDGYRKGTDKI